MLSNETKRFVHKWLSALRGGYYSQTTEVLQDKIGYCCLGVACDLFPNQSQVVIATDNVLEGVNLSDQPFVKKMFRDELGLNEDGRPILFNSENGYIGFDELTLAMLNDDGMKFDQIADFIEVTYGSEWEL